MSDRKQTTLIITKWSKRKEKGKGSLSNVVLDK